MPTLTNILKTILQGDARSYVQATQQAGSATDRFARSVLSANAALKRTERVRTDLGADEFEKQLEAFKQTEGALQRQKALRADLTRTQGNLTRAEVVATGAAVAFDAALGRVVSTGNRRQSTRLTFENQFGRGQGAAEFERLGRLSGPFSADAFRASALRLKEMGEGARDLEPDLRAVGNAAAFVGRGDEGLERLAGALGQARQQHAAAPFIEAMEAEGLQPFDVLKRRLGLSRPVVQAIGNDFSQSDRLLRALLQDMREMGGGRAMEDRLNTAEGSVQKFNDAMKDLSETMGSLYLPAETQAAKATTDFLRNLPPGARAAAGIGLGVGAGAANLLAGVGIPALTAFNTWKLAQMASAGGAAAEVAGGAGAAGLGIGAGPLALAVAAYVAPAIAGGLGLAAGIQVGKAVRDTPFVAGLRRGPLAGIAERLPFAREIAALAGMSMGGPGGGGVAGGVAMTPAEKAHLDQLQQQTAHLKEIADTNAALLGRATVPGGQGVVPFSEVPFRRQLVQQNLSRKGG